MGKAELEPGPRSSMRARCKVSFGCGVCLFSLCCFLFLEWNGCLLSWITSLLVSAWGWVEERLPLPSPPPHTPYRNYETHLLPRPDSWMVLYCHPYHPLILKHRDVLVNPGWAGALSFRNILYSTGNQQTPAPRPSRPWVSRLLGKAEKCQV